jgi:glycerophosphoryl diester phosphodiesterase
MENIKLVGFASLPADTFAEGPPAGGNNGNGEPISANGRTGPFDGQPVQGFSGVQFAPGSDGDTFWFLSDNGFGNISNSSDYLLRVYQVDPSFIGTENGDGSVDVQGFVQLSDPNNLIPFEIINEGTEDRLLTGSDFDIESIVVRENQIWIGDEFGPYLLEFDSNGVLQQAPIPTPNIPTLNTLNGQEPIIIGHRGASGPRPEHTLDGFRLALEQGSDFIETDYVMTKDGVPIVRHEPLLNNTTDILDRPEFSDRETTKVIDGVEYTGFFAEDFTLEEIKTLRAKQPLSVRSDAFDGDYEIPTMAEVIQLVKDYEAETGKKVGIVHELKHNQYFDSIGLNLEEATVRVLVEENFTDPEQNIIQTFQIAPLIRLDQEIMPEAGIDVPLHQLTGAATEDSSPGFSFPYDIVANFSNPDFTEEDAREVYGDLVDIIDLGADTGYGDLLALPEFYEFMATYAEAVNPWKNTILLREGLEEPVDGDGDGEAEIRSQLTGEVFPLIELAHDAGLLVNVYTLRDEERYLTLEADGSVQTPQEEAEDLIQLGADGLIGDFPLTIDQVRDQIVAEEVRSPQNPDLQFNTLTGEPPIVIAHRGSSGERPEHTLEAYERAIAQGADFIEPDLVSTKDGILIARHENELSGTTDVADRPEFADRFTTKMIDGREVEGWFSEDFTLEEIKTLRSIERIPDLRPDNTEFDGLFEIPTLEEVIQLVKDIEAETGKKIGIYPETKHPTYFDEIGLSLEEPLIQTLVDTDFTDPDRVFIQSFEVGNLQTLNNSIMPDAGVDLPLVQLVGGGGAPYDLVVSGDERTYADLITPEGLEEVATYADGIGPSKRRILPVETVDNDGDGEPDDLNGDGVISDADRVLGEPTSVIEDAHDAGLLVHPYTLRNEQIFLASDYNGDPGEEFEQLIELGVDGFFTDFPATGRVEVDQEIELPNLSGSRGYEGMAFSPDLTTLYPLLEGSVQGDPENALRIYEADAETGEFTGLVGFYPTDVPGHAIGDFTPINDTEFLVIERDNNQGEAAEFKKIFKIDISQVDENNFVEKEELVDLLNIADPDDLNGDGETTFTFPFVTIEDVLVLDEKTILVANDNNYPFSVGRGPDIDNNEIIQLELDEPLDLDPRLGVPVAVEPTDGNDVLVGSASSETIAGLLGDDEISGGEGDDTLRGDLNSRSPGGNVGGNDTIFGGLGNDQIGGKGGNDSLFGDEGDDLIWGDDGDDILRGGLGNDTLTGDDFSGGEGADMFVLAANEGTDTIVDFEVGIDVIGLANLTFADLSLTSESGNTAIAFGDETLAIIEGVDVSSFTEDSFTSV